MRPNALMNILRMEVGRQGGAGPGCWRPTGFGRSYSVSHDLRRPCPQRVRRRWRTTARLDEKASGSRLIQDNAHRMGQLIDDPLTFRLGRQQLMATRSIQAGEEVFGNCCTMPGRRIQFVRGVPPARGTRRCSARC
jgi:hypothetical protein